MNMTGERYARMFKASGYIHLAIGELGPVTTKESIAMCLKLIKCVGQLNEMLVKEE